MNLIPQLRSLIQKVVITDIKEPVATSNPLKSAIDNEIDLAVRKYIQKSNTVGLSIGIIYGDDTYPYGYGETEKGTGRIPDEHSIYEIGSITKTFTATILASFVLEELLD